jgi:hypothetical protein
MTAEVQAFIAAEKQADRNVVKACELLVVSRSAFYDRLGHTPSAREVSDAELVEKIKAIHAASGGTYGGRHGSSTSCANRASMWARSGWPAS